MKEVLAANRVQVSLPLDRTAALFIDLQEEHRHDRRLLAVGFDQVLANVARLQAAARAADLSLYHFAYVVDPAAETTRRYHPRLEDGRSAFSDKDDPLSAICPEVAPVADERLIVKTEASAFGSGFGDELSGAGIEWLVIAGVWTEACVDATVKDALKRDFRVLLVKDACGSGSVAMHQIGILNLANRLYGGAVVTTDAACRLMAGETVEAWSPLTPVPIRYGYEDAAAPYEAL
ncbi:MAG: isochorismatase family protein [Rhizobiaceae bacterium]|nr:isochorismatase family protein [Rhizobiaceae bacterium]MCV0407838.1 isochorismatase family protein [Rhizobiaceae bacterium]